MWKIPMQIQSPVPRPRPDHQRSERHGGPPVVEEHPRTRHEHELAAARGIVQNDALFCYICYPRMPGKTFTRCKHLPRKDMTFTDPNINHRAVLGPGEFLMGRV